MRVMQISKAKDDELYNKTGLDKVLNVSVRTIERYILDDEIEKNWEKCRLVLVRTENDIMLEFFPPDNKSIQPKSGLLCNMLDEIRQTKPLEMPERPYTALLRVSSKYSQYSRLT